MSESIDKIHKKVLFSEKKIKNIICGEFKLSSKYSCLQRLYQKCSPGLNKKIQKIKFCIVGNIKRQDKISLLKNKNVEILGSQKN